jgi:hypothetical protein
LTLGLLLWYDLLKAKDMADEVSVGATQGIIWAFVGVSTIFTVARLYTRLKIVNKIGLDDYLMAFSLVRSLDSQSKKTAMLM